MTIQKRSRRFCHLMQLTAMLFTLVVDAVRFFRCCLRSPTALAAENLLLRIHCQHRRQLPPDSRVVAKPILGGLHHEYRLERRAA